MRNRERVDLIDEIDFIIMQINKIITKNISLEGTMPIQDQADLNRYSNTLLALCQSQRILEN